MNELKKEYKVIDYYCNGHLWYSYCRIDGLIQGEFKCYNSNGEISFYSYYISNQLEGEELQTIPKYLHDE